MSKEAIIATKAQPYGGLRRDGTPATTGPHLLVAGPTEIGKSRRVLAPAAIAWQGPVVAISSKDDLLKLVAQRRYTAHGGELVKSQLLDLRPLRGAVYPDLVTPVRSDPTTLVRDIEDAISLAEQLIQIGTVGSGGKEDVTDASIWDALALAPLACILFAASPAANEILGAEPRGVAWALAATARYESPADDEQRPSWALAARIAREAPNLDGELLFEQAEGVREMNGRQRDSVAINVRTALSAWIRPSVRRPSLPVLDPRILEYPMTTLHVIPPEDGAAAAAAIGVIDSLITRWREREAAGRNDARLLLVIDELPNTVPLPKLATYIAEARGLGVNIIASVQATSQLRRKYGSQVDELRDVFPATLIMRGAPELESVEQAAKWEKKTTRIEQSYDPASGARTNTESVTDMFDTADLLPKTTDVARLLKRGTAGELVAVPDYSTLFPAPGMSEHEHRTALRSEIAASFQKAESV